MDRILFIVPPNISFDSFVRPAASERVIAKKSGKYGSVVTDMPLGILSMSAYLKKHSDVKTRLMDFNIILNKLESFEYKSFSDLFRGMLSGKEWIDYSPSIIGISALFTPTYRNMMDLASIARQIFPKAIIIAGGGVPTNLYHKIFEESTNFDALCYGEGEKPLLGLFESDDKIKYLEESPSWITRDKAKNGYAFRHDFIENLDEIPFLDYEISDQDEYKFNLMSLFPLMPKGKKGMPIMTSRGCPHRCSFCSSHTVHGKKMRYQNLPRVREDFRRLKEQYGAEIMVFFDDHLMANKQRVFEIIQIMRDLQLTAFFPSSLALYALDRKVLESLRSIGVAHLILSVESGSDRVLKEVMHKVLNLSIVKRVIEDCRDLGIATDLSILIGLPGETKQDLEDALTFFKTINPTWFRISVATPLVGSEMLEICLKKNYIKGDYLDSDFKRCVVETEDFTSEYIQEKAYSMNLELNFVENGDFKLGNYEVALKGFENTIGVKNDHAFAYYFASKCCQKMGLKDKYEDYKTKYQDVIKKSAFWINYANQFMLAPLE